MNAPIRKRGARGTLALGALILAAGALACAPAEDQGPSLALEVTEGAPSSTTSIIERIAFAPQCVAFHGLRRVRSLYRLLDQPHELELLERVAADGAGRFALEVEDVLVPRLSADEEQLFALVASQRAGFSFRHRDFGIHPLDQFAQSYRIEYLGQREHLGRTALELDVRRRENPARHYRLLVDALTGVVLAADELTLAGELISSSRFEEIHFEAPPAEVAYYEPPFEREPLDSDASLEETLGFAVLRPSLLPAGYRPIGMDRFEDAGRTWVREIFGDGVEELFFLHSPMDPAPANPSGPGALLESAEHETDTPAGRLTVAPIGPWLVVEGEVGGHSVIALGKVSEAGLIGLIQSAVESSLLRQR